MTWDAVDVFAGPGGWDVAAQSLGLRVLGVELDDAACATRAAAGLETVQGDVAALDPAEYVGVRGLIGSPPCPTFSAAGTGLGRALTDLLVRCALELAAGNDTREQARAEAFEILRGKVKEERARRDADMTVLVVEPLRWALAIRPEWIALEQVPPVLELWSLFAQILQTQGYSCWTGVLEAERYGVPQTRERAILLAKRGDVTVHPPAPTHQRYVFGEPQRHDVTLEGEILPWVSMAEALGWGATARPYPTIACSSSSGGPDMEKVGGSGARKQLYDEQESGRWLLRNGNQENACVRPVDEPAGTLFFGDRLNAVDWVFQATNDRPNGARRAADQPAPTLAFGHETQRWTRERPATTIAGDPRVFQPGGHHANDGRRSDPEADGRSKNAIRVSIEEAGMLQSFPAEYPWQGNKSEQFRQVGNAVPPLLARAILAEITR